MGKGDKRRPSQVPTEEYDRNFEAIFGQKKLNVWEPDDGCPCGSGVPEHECEDCTKQEALDREEADLVAPGGLQGAN